MFNPNPYLKAITGAIVAGIAPLVAAEVASPHALTTGVWITSASAFFTGLYTVYATTNTPKASAPVSGLLSTSNSVPSVPLAATAPAAVDGTITAPIAQPEGFMGGS